MTEKEKDEVRHTLKFMVGCYREALMAMDKLCKDNAIPKDDWKGIEKRNGDRRK